MRIGDTVTRAKGNTAEPLWDGTVVDIWDTFVSPASPSADALVRVYWRYPLGKIGDHRISELEKVG